MLSNACFLAKFRFDTAANEPAKNLQKFAKFAKFAKFVNFADPNPLTFASGVGGDGMARPRVPQPPAKGPRALRCVADFV